ncbi:MAG: hydrogenase maturation nickel metallochaperone HypA [Saezia sp.]
MHEVSLCQSAVELIEKQISGHSVQKVTAVWFEAGATACIEEEALRFAFDCASQGTLLEGAQVHFKVLPAQAWCWNCEKAVEIKGYGDACPHCHEHQLNVNSLSSDMEFKVKQIEVE